MGMNDESTEKIRTIKISSDYAEYFAEKKISGIYTVKGIESIREKIRMNTKSRLSDKNPLFEVLS